MQSAFRSTQFIYLILGTLLAVWPALYNGFPLIYSDSGTYMVTSVTLESPMDRPLFYGIFLRITAMQAILWIPLFVQGLLTAWLLQRTLRTAVPAAGSVLHTVLFLVLCFLTGLPWYASQIMPDMFTPLIALLLYLVYYDRNAGRGIKIFYYILLFASSGMHLSNVLIAGIMIALHALVFPRKTLRNIAGLRTNALLATGTLSLTVLAHSFFTYQQFGVFRPSINSDLFIAAKCFETPLMKTYMRENPHHISIPFREQADSIPDSPMGFLWGGESPLNAPGVDRIAISKQFGPVIRDMLSIPKYRRMFLWQSLEGTWQQLQYHRVGCGLISYREFSPPQYAIESYFETELGQYKHARQYTNKYGLEDNYHQYISEWVFFLSLIIILTGLLFRTIRRHQGALILLMISCVAANAFVTASLANIYDRLQGRVVWLLTFTAMIALFHWWKHCTEKEQP